MGGPSGPTLLFQIAATCANSIGPEGPPTKAGNLGPEGPAHSPTPVTPPETSPA
ncbi:DUF6053 domain-containing protein [Lysobacter enzymogenes]|uniref:DUF6053 domain-containing protein n=1 Tax=Lysobacter enzymogenes TaxID=69 RepID=UPI003D18A489